MKAITFPHQYIDRSSHQVITEKPIADRTIQFLYNSVRENVPAMFNALTSGRMSSLLGFLQYDLPGKPMSRGEKLFKKYNADWRECLEPVSYYTSPRRFFERQIHYWTTREMEDGLDKIVSPADSRVLIGSFKEASSLFIKEKFFNLEELLGRDRDWSQLFTDGDFGVFRLTPDKYHYNHTPVSGRVIDLYQVDGQYHSCNPTAQIAMASVYSKNRRVVTLIDTDVEGGTGVGMVAMIEIVALMIGDIVQCYSKERYDSSVSMTPGMFIEKGCPKSLFRPGSSTDVLIFEPNRMSFSEDLVRNSRRHDVNSRFTSGFGKPLVETDVMVRSTIGKRNTK